MKALIFGGNSLVRYTAVALLAVGMNIVPGGDASAARLAAGSAHSLAIKADGTVWAWGGNNAGQLGNGTYSSQSYFQSSPSQVPGLTRVVSVSARFLASAALKSDGTVWVWGSSRPPTPTRVVGLTDVVAVAIEDGALSGNNYTSVAVKSDGTVWVWGYNGATQTTPVQVSGLTGVIAVGASVNQSFTTRFTALKSNGTVWNWQSSANAQTTPVQVSGLSNISAIAAGPSHILALGANGTVWGWGNNQYGQLGNGVQGPTIVTPVQVSGLTGVKSIVAGLDISQAVKSDGTLWMWGDNRYAQVFNSSIPAYLTPVQLQITGFPAVVKNIEATTPGMGRHHVFALRSDGSILEWYTNYVPTIIPVAF